MKYNSYYLLVKPFENCSPLWYSSNNNIKVGSIVSIDLRNRKTLGIVKEIRQTYPLEKVIKIKSIEQEIFINDEIYEKFINQLTFLYQTKKETILAKITNFLKAKECEAEQIFQDTKNLGVELSNEQEIIFKEIKNSFNKGFSPHLIHGVTGSGKTSIYKKITKEILKNQRSVIITAPEITVANHLYNEIKSEIPNSYRIYTGISTKEKNDLWQALKEKNSIVIIGVHIPALLPISNLGLIIVDEEHETGYQEKQPPYLNSKDCLMIRAAHNKIPIVLGSATPNVNSYNLFKKNNWPIYLLKERYNGEMPYSKVCYFKFDKKRENFWITSTLEKSIQENLQKKQQTIIFLNRRGFSFFLSCEDCGYVPQCKYCTVSLTPHDDNKMFCHYCGFNNHVKSKCKDCKKETNFLHKGIGTQQLVKILKKIFPSAVIERADMDITKSKKKWSGIIKDMHSNKIDILVGTQSISKGLHFPNVTLVGVIWADLGLNLPQYNAAEKTLQQILQVSGRAGRSTKNSKVIIQAMHSHYIFDYLKEEDYKKFIKKEEEVRKLSEYPPSCRLTKIEIKNKNLNLAQKESDIIYNQIKLIKNFKVYGPVLPAIEKIESVYTVYIFVKSQNINEVASCFQNIKSKNSFYSKINFIPSAVN